MHEVKTLPAIIWYWHMGWRSGIVIGQRQTRKTGEVTYRVLATAQPSIVWLPAADISSRVVEHHAKPYPLSKALRHCQSMLRAYKASGQTPPANYRKALLELRAGGVA